MVSFGGKQTLVDLIELGIVDFNVILCMDWLHSCYVSWIVRPVVLSLSSLVN